MTKDPTVKHDSSTTTVAFQAIADLVRVGRVQTDTVATMQGIEPRCRILVDHLTGHLDSILPAMTDVKIETWRGESGWLYRDHIGFLLTWKITVQELYGTAAAAAGECDRPATVRIEGYQPGTIGSLDVSAYACADHVDAYVEKIKDRGLGAWRCPGPVPGTPERCGKVVDYGSLLPALESVVPPGPPAPAAPVSTLAPPPARGVAAVVSREDIGRPEDIGKACREGSCGHPEHSPAPNPETVAPIVIRAVAYLSAAGVGGREYARHVLDSWDLRPDMSDEDMATVLDAFPDERQAS